MRRSAQHCALSADLAGATSLTIRMKANPRACFGEAWLTGSSEACDPLRPPLSASTPILLCKSANRTAAKVSAARVRRVARTTAKTASCHRIQCNAETVHSRQYSPFGALTAELNSRLVASRCTASAHPQGCTHSAVSGASRMLSRANTSAAFASASECAARRTSAEHGSAVAAIAAAYARIAACATAL